MKLFYSFVLMVLGYQIAGATAPLHAQDDASAKPPDTTPMPWTPRPLHQLDFARSTSAIGITDFMIANEEIADKLLVAPFQKAEFKKIKKEFNEKLASLKDELELAKEKKDSEEQSRLLTKIVQLKREFAQILSTFLLPDQMAFVMQFDPRTTGYRRIVIHNEFRKALELSDSQIEKINSNAKELETRIEDTIKNLRQEAYDSVFAELTNKQIEILKTYFSEEDILAFHESASLDQLYMFSLVDGYSEKVGWTRDARIPKTTVKSK